MRVESQLVITTIFALGIGFLGGIGTASGKGTSPYQTTVNSGLVQASDSVLKNLLGSEAVAVHEDGQGGVTIDLAGETMIPVGVNFFQHAFPPDPCKTVLHVGLDSGVTDLNRDPSWTADGNIEPIDIGGFPPDPCMQDLSGGPAPSPG